MKTRKSIISTVLLIVGIIVLVNVLSSQYFFRLDFTADKRYTLSEATENILKSLKKPVTVTAYFSQDLPPNIARVRSDFKDLLIEYANRSKGMVVYNFINPNKDDKTEKEAMKHGVQPVIVNVRKKDQMQQQKAFLGAVIKMGDKTDVIPFMRPGAAMEYALSSSIKKLSVDKKPMVGLVEGNGEASLSSMQQAYAGLSVLYNVKEFHISDTSSIPTKYRTLAIVNPQDTVPPAQLQELDKFLARGGRLYIAMNTVNGDLQHASGKAFHTGLAAWLQSKGINVESKFVIDANCGNVTVRQRQGFFNFSNQISFPYLPIIQNFADHPITKGLSSILMPFAGDIKFTGDTNKVKYVPLAMTSDKSGLQKPPVFFDIQKKWTKADFPLSNLAVAGAFTGKFGGKDTAKIVVIANGDFAINGTGQQARQQSKDNINLMVNSIDWLSDDTGLINLRTKGITSRPLKDIKESTKELLKYLNFLLPILLVIIYGFIRMQMKRNTRIKRMEENYV